MGVNVSSGLRLTVLRKRCFHSQCLLSSLLTMKVLDRRIEIVTTCKILQV